MLCNMGEGLLLLSEWAPHPTLELNWASEPLQLLVHCCQTTHVKTLKKCLDEHRTTDASSYTSLETQGNCNSAFSFDTMSFKGWDPQRRLAAKDPQKMFFLEVSKWKNLIVMQSFGKCSLQRMQRLNCDTSLVISISCWGHNKINPAKIVQSAAVAVWACLLTWFFKLISCSFM